jgi:AdoMet-dependent heme synthase
LSCLHCRASAIIEPLPGELTTDEGRELIEQVIGFGEPYPTIIFTGGDPLQRRDLFELMAYAAKKRISFAVSPAVTDVLTDEALLKIKNVGASSISISLDGASRATHDTIRQKAGTFDNTIKRIGDALKMGLNVQVNTAIMKQNLHELPQIFSLIRRLGVRTWELFFIIRVGRGAALEDLTPLECESVCRFLVRASCYGMTIRTVEAPFVRRVAKQMTERVDGGDDTMFDKLRRNLVEQEGEPTSPSTIRARGTLDGDGIVFVAYDGSIYPGGLTPHGLGNIKTNDLSDVYRKHPLLGRIRRREFEGYCSICQYQEICGGSRARAYSHYGDALASDPACVYSEPNV